MTRPSAPLLARLGALVLLAIVIPACRTQSRPSTQSLNPLDRALAARRIAERGDAQGVHSLVQLLLDDDPAVRMYASRALHELVGTDYGYRYYASAPERAAAVERWRAALRRGEIVVRGQRATPAPAEQDQPS